MSEGNKNKKPENMSKEELLKLLAEKDEEIAKEKEEKKKILAGIDTMGKKIEEKLNENDLKNGGSTTITSKTAGKESTEHEDKAMEGKVKLGFYEKLSEEVKYMMTPKGIIEYGCEKQKELPKEKLERESEIIKEKVKEYLKAFDELDDAIQEIESAKDTERYYVLLKELDEKMMNDENVPYDAKIIYESIYTDRFLHCPTGKIVTEYNNYKKRIEEEVNNICKIEINNLQSYFIMINTQKNSLTEIEIEIYETLKDKYKIISF